MITKLFAQISACVKLCVTYYALKLIEIILNTVLSDGSAFRSRVPVLLQLANRTAHRRNARCRQVFRLQVPRGKRLPRYLFHTGRLSQSYFIITSQIICLNMSINIPLMLLLKLQENATFHYLAPFMDRIQCHD